MIRDQDDSKASKYGVPAKSEKELFYAICIALRLYRWGFVYLQRGR